MAVESSACPACGEHIAPGRLSCPQCGTVLAAVARSWRSEPAGHETAPVVAPQTAPSWLDSATETAAAPVEADATPIPSPVAALLDAAPDRWSSPAFDDRDEGEPGGDHFVEDALPLPVVDEPAPARSLLRPNARTNPFLDDGPLGGVPDAAERPLLEPDSEPTRTPAAYEAAAYVPPATAVLPGSTAGERDAGAATATDDVPARILPRAWDPAAAAAERATAAAPSTAVGPAARRGRLALPGIDRARIDEAAGVVVLAGSMGTLVGFLLPWSRVVIGSRGAGTYVDTWGLAGQGHLVVFLLALGALALAAIPNRIDTWLRTGVVGIALGALVLGLAWPYAFGPLGAGIGIVLLVVAACLLLLGGLLSTLVQRHGGPPPGV